MDAEAYLASLVKELLAAAAVASNPTALQVLRAQLHGAVRALEALALVERGAGEEHVTRFDRLLGERGVVEEGEAHVSSIVSATAVAGEAAGAPSEEMVPWLKRVVRLEAELDLGQLHATYLLCLISWSHFAQLVYATAGRQLPLATGGDRLERARERARLARSDAVEWQVWDDRGTRYQVAGGGGGGGTVRNHYVNLHPAVPDAATQITIAAQAPGAGAARRTFAL